jgi:hypothetical protein
VNDAHAKILSNAARLRATFKEPPSIADTYTFIGVVWNHGAQAVSVAAKTLKRIGDHVEPRAPKTYYVSLVSRLIFAAGVLRTPLARYYLAIKMANRYANALNTGADATVSFPVSVLPTLQEWVNHAHTTRRICPNEPTDSADIAFCDASTHGYGVYVFWHTGEASIHGGAWDATIEVRDSAHMAELEAQAFANMWDMFKQRFLIARNVDFRIDNSSVAAAVQKGHAHSQALNDRLADTLAEIADCDVRFTVKLIASANNLADSASRGNDTRAMATPDVSRGVVGRAAA